MSKTFLMRDGDLYIDRETGKSATLEGNAKLAQDIAHTLLTVFDSDRRYGFEFAALINPVIISQAAENLIKMKISECLDRLKVQIQQDPYSNATERIDKILRLVVRNLGGSNYFFFVRVQPEEGEPIERMVAVSLRHRNTPLQPVQPFSTQAGS
jgi:hypothetical protein